MTEPILFPTEHRDKHRKEVSYPLGARDISMALADVPQASAFKLHFLGGNKQQTLYLEPSIYVFNVHYRKRARTHFDSAKAVEWGVFEVFWTISVCVVPSALRSLVHAKLIEEALPEVRTWLIEHDKRSTKLGPLIGEQGLSYTFETGSNALLLRRYGKLEPERAR